MKNEINYLKVRKFHAYQKGKSGNSLQNTLNEQRILLYVCGLNDLDFAKYSLMVSLFNGLFFSYYTIMIMRIHVPEEVYVSIELLQTKGKKTKLRIAKTIEAEKLSAHKILFHLRIL